MNFKMLAAVMSVAAAWTAFGGFSREKFRNPENIHSPAYFWMWNSKLEPAKLNAQLDDTQYASSVAHQQGHMLAMTESFGIYGNAFTPDQMKWVVDFQLLRGINMFVFGYYNVSACKCSDRSREARESGGQVPAELHL